MLLLSAVITVAVALAGAPPTSPAAGHLPPRPMLPGPLLPLRPHPERPDDGLLGKGKFEVKIVAPPEMLSLIQHVDEDRDGIAGYVTWALWLATVGVGLAALAVVRYLCSGWGRPQDA